MLVLVLVAVFVFFLVVSLAFDVVKYVQSH